MYRINYSAVFKQKPGPGKRHSFSNEAALITLIIRSMVNKEEKIGKLLDSGQIDWVKFKSLVAYHELAPFAYLALRRFNSLLPQDLYALLRNSYYHDLARCQHLWQEFLRVLTVFEQAKIKVLPIKGMAVLEDLYIQYPARPIVDIDLLIEEKEIREAERIFSDLGYQKELRGCKEKYWREKQIHFPFHRKEGKINFLIELHWMLDFKRKNRFVLQEFWKRIRNINVGERAINVLSPEDTLFSLALHSRRFGKTLCLKNVYDSVLLLDKYADSFDWDYCLEMSKKYELNSVLFFMLCRVQFLFDKDIPEYIWKRLRVSEFKRRVIRRFIEKNTFSQHMDKRGNSLYLTSHFLLYDTFWEPVKYIIDIPQEQFAKYYGLSPYDRKTERSYCLRLLYIPFRRIIDCFKRSEQFKEIKPKLSEEKNEARGLAVVRAWGFSMHPAIIDGDLVILKKKNFCIGEVICFKNQPGKDVIHRVVRLGRDWVITKGDNSVEKDKLISLKDVIGVAIAVKRGDKLYPITRRCLYTRIAVLSWLVIFSKRAVKRAILWGQDFRLYDKLINFIFKNRNIEVEKEIEADDFYFMKAKLNGKYAGHIKIDKKKYTVLSIYVKIWFRHLGVEDKLIERHREISKLFADKKTKHHQCFC